MKQLILTDLRRFFKNKFIIVIAIVAVAIPLFGALAEVALLNLSDPPEGYRLQMSLLSIINDCFSLTSNCGLLILIMGCVLLDRDRKGGILRNKLICGKTRTQIYFSAFLCTLIFFLTCIIGYILVSVGINAIFFDFDVDYAGFGETLLKVISLGIVNIIFSSALATFLSLICQKTTALLQIAILFSITLIGTIFIICLVLTADDILDFVNTLEGITENKVYVTEMILYLIGAVGFTVWGWLAFQTREIK